jgi:hypothetical protein
MLARVYNIRQSTNEEEPQVAGFGSSANPVSARIENLAVLWLLVFASWQAMLDVDG